MAERTDRRTQSPIKSQVIDKQGRKEGWVKRSSYLIEHEQNESIPFDCGNLFSFLHGLQHLEEEVLAADELIVEGLATSGRRRGLQHLLRYFHHLDRETRESGL